MMQVTQAEKAAMRMEMYHDQREALFIFVSEAQEAHRLTVIKSILKLQDIMVEDMPSAVVEERLISLQLKGVC